MTQEKRDQRIIIPFTKAEVEEIEGWWHEERLPSRAAAIRQLIRLGIWGSKGCN